MVPKVWLVATAKPSWGSSWPIVGVSSPNLISPTMNSVMSHPCCIGYYVSSCYCIIYVDSCYYCKMSNFIHHAYLFVLMLVDDELYIKY